VQTVHRFNQPALDKSGSNSRRFPSSLCLGRKNSSRCVIRRKRTSRGMVERQSSQIIMTCAAISLCSRLCYKRRKDEMARHRLRRILSSRGARNGAHLQPHFFDAAAVYNGEENQVPRSTLKSHPRELCFPQHFLLADFSAKNVNSHNRHRATRLAQVRLKTLHV
jgi:hypothetical protein